MNKEKMLKKQALAYLSKNNWGNAIGGFFIMLMPFIIIILANDLMVSLLDAVVDLDKINILQSLFIILFEGILLVSTILATPVFTGYQKLCYNISKGKENSLSDVFYYFKGGLYGKCLRININIMFRILGYFCGFGAPALFMIISSTFSSNETSGILTYIYVVYLVVLIIGTFFWAMRYTVIPCVLFEDESLSSSEIVKIGLQMAKPRLSTINMLTLSFFPYLLLCFFVVPLIFVVPYMNVAYMTNGKWITQMYLTSDNSNTTNNQVMPKGTM